MQAAIFLAALIVGQNCGPNGCGLPSYQPSYQPMQSPSYGPALDIMPFLQPATRLPAARPRPRHVIKTYNVYVDGVKFDVQGYKDAETGLIMYHEDEPFNRLSRSVAVERAHRTRDAAKVTEKPERRPTAKPEPLTEPEAGKSIGAVADPFPGGVVAEKIGKRAAYTAPSAEAKRFVEEAQASPEGVGKVHVTVIGTDDERAPVVNDLKTNPALAGLAMMVQDYKSDEWPVDPSLGFQTGKPEIVVQTAKGPTDPKGGRVVYRAKDYSMGPLGLAEAVRKADPNYKPANDPGPANPNSPANAGKCPLGFTKDHWPVIAVVALGLVYLLKLPKKEG